MKQKIKKQWIAALRSGKYKQTKGKIRNGNQHGIQHCCLGVLSDLAVKQGVCTEKKAFYGNNQVLAPIVLEWAGLNGYDPSVNHDGITTNLSSWNDEKNYTFPQIADLIEENL